MKATFIIIVKIIATIGFTALSIHWGALGLIMAFPIVKIWEKELKIEEK